MGMNRYFFVASLVFCATANAQEEILDLALAPGSEIELTVPPGTVLQVKLINRLPTRAYTERATVEPIPILELNFSALGSRSPCGEVINGFLRELASASTETEVASLVLQARTEGATACSDVERQELNQAIDQKTTHTLRPVALALGERYVVEVSRVEGDEALSWKATYTTGPRGRWLTTYGVGFLPDQDEEFFTESRGDGTFAIQPKEPAGGLDFVPAIFFTWLPRKWENRNWAFSPVGGLGFDVSSPVVFLGGAAIFNQNLSVLAGAVFHQQKRLDGQYQVGQVVGEALTPDQLAVEPYHANFFFAVAFRFGSNPFSSGE